MITRSRSSKSRPSAPQPHRGPIEAIALILVLTAVPLAAQRPAPAQRGGVPRADTPQLLIGPFSSSDPALGLQAADAVRRRIQSEHNATDLYVVPKPTIDQRLRSSGYNPDSALATTDLWELAKQVRSDYALAGTVERTATGVRSTVRLLTQTGKEIVAEPLAPMVGSDFGDIAKQVDRAVSDAIRALLHYQECTNALRVGDFQKAIASAQQGLRLRPTSAALNICVLSTLIATKAAPDSIIAVALQITAVDSASTLAWGNLAYAYEQKHDSVHALGATLALHRLDPANINYTTSLIDLFVNSGQTEPALALLDTALRAAPDNADLLRRRWALDHRLGHAAEALVSGAALIAADTSAATVFYYGKQLTAAKDARDSVSIHRLALEASARFPKNTNFLLILGREALDHGSATEALGFVERALAIEPTNSVALQLAITAYAKTGAADSAFATARRALAANVPSDAVGASLLAVVSPALSAAQTSQARADWETVLRLARAVDTVATSPRSAFYVGYAAFAIATDDVQSLAEFSKRKTPTRAERVTACASATRLEELVNVVTIAMPRGGRVDPAAAGKIMTALPGYSEFVTSVKRANCR